MRPRPAQRPAHRVHCPGAGALPPRIRKWSHRPAFQSAPRGPTTSGTPDGTAAALAALRDGFQRALRDKDLLAEAEKARFVVAPVSGDDSQKVAQELVAMPDSVKSKLKALLYQ